MIKYTDNPPMLPEGTTSVRDLAGQWWVAHTKARNEKAFAWDLHRRGIGYYLPMYPKTIISANRKRRLLMPVFTSYVFFCGTPEDRHNAFTTNRIAATLDVKAPDRLVRELSYFERVLAMKVPLSPKLAIKEGTLCRVTSGPLQGIEGLVVKKGNVSTFFLRVSIIAGGALLEIDGELLDPVK
jgi:transcription termination factor NusG